MAESGSSKKPLLIVNPRSGGGRTGRVFEQMRSPIQRSLGDFDVTFTERGRHAVDIARDAALEGRTTVVAVGGDGSIHEVVNGLMQAREKGATEARLGVIGQGTGGDLRRSLELEHRLDRYCAAIARGKTRPLDVGRFTYATHEGGPAHAWFVNILSVGLGGVVDQLVASAGRQFGGTFAYYSATLQGLMRSEIGVLECTIYHGADKREEEVSTRSMAICNGRFFGSGMEVAPMARLDDGLFEVVDLGAASRVRFFLESSSIYSGKHLKSPDVRHFKCDRIGIVLRNESISDRFLLDVDGEPLGRLPIEIDMVKGALEVFAP